MTTYHAVGQDQMVLNALSGYEAPSTYPEAWEHFHDKKTREVLTWLDDGSLYTATTIRALKLRRSTHRCLNPACLYDDLPDKVDELRAEADAIMLWLADSDEAPGPATIDEAPAE